MEAYIMKWPSLVEFVASHAPLLGSVLGGPMGNMVGQVIADKFGGDINAPETLLEKIKADPESSIKLRQIQADETVNLQRLSFLQAESELKYSLENTANARQSNIKTDTVFPQLLSVVLVVGFFLCLYWIAAFPQDKNDHDILNLLMGVAASSFAAVVNYWLGSSADRTRK